MGDHETHGAGGHLASQARPTDTIAAVATPPGRGGVGIVRISGPTAPAIARTLLGRLPAPRYAAYGVFRDAYGEPIDRGLLLYFPSPGSFTGEDVVELHGHGGPVVLDMLLQRILGLGARPARPGEFSERAFLNDKLDLAQAEAIADLIDSSSRQAARSALRSLEGAFSREVQALLEGLIELRTHVEAALDFPDEEVDALAEAAVGQRLQGLVEQLEGLLARARQGSLLREGMTLVLAGRPNAGKSSVLNALAGRETAIVTELPGTTRDVLRESIDLDGLPLHVIDTAGLRDSDHPVEQEGVRRAWGQIEQADQILLVVDASVGWTSEDTAIRERLPDGPALITAYNKIDLSGHAAGGQADAFYLSALTGAGVEGLRRHLESTMGFRTDAEGVFMARQRHLEALRATRGHLQGAGQQLAASQAGELVAEELHRAQRALAEVTGEFTSEDLLGRIFSSFCIGK